MPFSSMIFSIFSTCRCNIIRIFSISLKYLSIQSIIYVYIIWTVQSSQVEYSIVLPWCRCMAWHGFRIRPLCSVQCAVQCRCRVLVGTGVSKYYLLYCCTWTRGCFCMLVGINQITRPSHPACAGTVQHSAASLQQLEQ